MAYSIVGIIAVLVHLIINEDVLFRHGRPVSAEKEYRYFLVGVILYHASDALWGVFHAAGWHTLLYVDTVVYFLLVAVSVLLWTRYVLVYLGGKNVLGKVIFGVGIAFAVLLAGFLLVNFFDPLIFTVTEAGEYIPAPGRYVVFGFQIILFTLVFIDAMIHARLSKDETGRRYRTVGLFSIAMAVSISAQMFYDLMPLYSIGYLLGCCVLHTFVVQAEREAFLGALATSRTREQKSKEELAETRRIAYMDPLTEAGSKLAYVEDEARMNERIARGDAEPFAVAVFDLNSLKEVNDTVGHETGDFYIISSCRMIARTFPDSPVFRIGGDEFVAILIGRDYESRKEK
ncbi:MAG: GGDEF domain-containing protein, partial [Clostridia bacterium]|nr:GGDEF domain-containing protein [Clostridia bacterium]